MFYVMSDIHGNYEKFIEMLNKINFSKEDVLYIIGDVIDRMSGGLKIIDYIIGHKNVFYIKGNHEKLFIDAYETNDYSLWYYNGGQTTHFSLMDKPFEYEEQLYRYLKNLPLFKIVKNKYILVHASLFLPLNYNNLSIEEILKAQNENFCLWNRKFIGNEKELKDYIIISGHTPTKLIDKNMTEPKFIKRKGHIYIDCGAPFIDGALGCLRLDDMKEFYI